MSVLADRIRRARALAKMSQQTLADVVGVQRAAVTQWESSKGHLPTMGHLIAIANATGVMLEWLGTGRGPVKPEQDAWVPAVRPDDYAQDERELECLVSLRRLPQRVRDYAIGLVKVMAEPYRTEATDHLIRSEGGDRHRNGVDLLRR